MEIERLDWRAVNFAAGYITVSAKNAKTRSRRTVPMSKNLREWLLPLAKEQRPVWAWGHDHFYKTMIETAKAAKLEWSQNVLRHSFISYRLALTQNDAQTALDAGNSPTMVHQHYKALQGVTKAEAKKYFTVGPALPTNVAAMPRTRRGLRHEKVESANAP